MCLATTLFDRLLVKIASHNKRSLLATMTQQLSPYTFRSLILISGVADRAHALLQNEFGTMRTHFFIKQAEEEMETACFSTKAQMLKHMNEAMWMMKCRPRKDVHFQLISLFSSISLFFVHKKQLSGFQALKERKSSKGRTNKVPMLLPIQHKEQFIQSLAESEPLHLLASRVPHG